MLAPRRDIAWLQSDFYRDQFRKILRWLMIALLIILLMIGGVIYLILFQPPTNYYVNTTEGKILPITPTGIT